MDLKSMNRKELQALCKTHGIPANTKNSEMIESLSSILQEKVKPKGCLKGSGGSSAEDLGLFRGGSKKVTFVIEDVKEDGDEEFVVNPVGKSKRKSVGRGSRVSAKLDSSSSNESPKNAIEVLGRTTRSRGLAEAVLWSSVIEKKMKKTGDGTGGVRQNAKEKKGVSTAVPRTRSLRNRVVTVGGDEEVVTDQNPRRTLKTKDSLKEEENGKVAALDEHEAVGRRNLRKRSRDAESVEDEPPRRRSARSHVKPEEAETVEEVDVGRFRKRRKGDLEGLVVEKVVEEGTDKVSNLGGNAKRLKGNASGDANHSEAVATTTRRSTRSFSALLGDGNFAVAVREGHQEAGAVRKGKSNKQAKAHASKGGDLVNLLSDREVLAEPVRRSTRSSSTLPNDGTSLPVVVKSVKGDVAVKKGKSLKQAKNNNSKGGNTATSLPVRETTAMPIRRSTRSSSSLLENGTSIPVVGKSIEEVEVVTTPTRRLTCSSSKLLDDEKLNEAVTSPTRRSIQSSSKFLNSQSSSKLLEVEKLNNEAFTSPTRRSTRSSLKLLENEMPNYEAVNSPARRLTRSSLKLVEDMMPNNEAVRLAHGFSKSMDDVMPNSEAVTSSTRKSTRSSSKFLEVELPRNEAVTSDTERATRSSSKLFEEEMPSNEAVSTSSRRLTCSSSEQGDSTAPLQYSEAFIPARRLTRSSSKLVSVEIPNNEVVTSSARRLIQSSVKFLKDEILDNGSVATPARRSTRSSLKMLAAETSLSVVCKLDVKSDIVRNDDSGKQPMVHTAKQVDSTVPSWNTDAVVTSTRRSTCSSSKLFENLTPTNKTAAKIEALVASEQHELPRRSTRSVSKQEESFVSLRRSTRNVSKQEEPFVSAASLNVTDEIPGINRRKKCTREAASKDDAFVVEKETIGGSGSRRTLQVGSTSSQRKCLRKVAADCELVQRQCSPHSFSRLSEHDMNVAEVNQSQVNVLLQMDENGTSLVATPKDLEAVCFGSHIGGKQSPSRELENMGRGLLSLNLTEDSSDIRENVSGQPMHSNIHVIVGAERPLELYEDVIGKVSAPVEVTSPTAKASGRGTSVSALDGVVGIAGMQSEDVTPTPLPLKTSEELSTAFHTESFNVAQLKEPDSAEEVVEREDMVTDYDAAHVSSPQLQCKSSAEVSMTSDTEGFLQIHLEGPNSQAEILDSTEDVSECNEATYVRKPAFVCKSSELLSPSLNSEASPETYLKEPDTNVLVEGPNEDVIMDSGATKIIDPMTSSTEVCPNAFCDINTEVFDAKGGMEGTDGKNSAGSPLSCKSSGVLSPTLPSEPDIDIGKFVFKAGSHNMSKVAAHSNDFLDEASDNHSKTLKVSTTADWDALYLSDIQRMFDNETENCLTGEGSTLNAPSAPGECNIGKKVDSPPGNNDPPSCEVGLEIVKETWVSSTLSVTVNEGIRTEEDKNDAEANVDEGRPSSSSEHPILDLCSGDLIKERRTQSSEEIMDQASSHGNAKQSDFSQSLCAEDLADIHGNLRDPFDDKFSEDNNDNFLSPVAFGKPEDIKSSHYKVDVLSSEIREENWNVEHGSSIQSLASSSKSVKQMETEDRLHDADLKSTRFSGSVNDNRSPISLSYEGSTKQVGIREFSFIPDNEDSRQLSDQQEAMVNVTGGLDVDSTDRSAKSTPKAHDTVKPLNVVADILSETADTANEHADTEFERSHELGAVVAEESENPVFLESNASIEGVDTVMKKADSVGQDKFDYVEIGQQQDESYLLQETKALSGEHHTDDICSHPSAENSASMPEGALLSLENFDSSTHGKNESNDEKEIRAKRESILPCNIHEGLFDASGESNEEERARISPIKPESALEATMIGEQHTAPSTSETTPPLTSNCEEAGLCKESSFGGANSVDMHDEDNDLKSVYVTNNVGLKESSDLKTIIARSKTEEGEHGVDHCINMSFCGMTQDFEDTGISENNEASTAADSSSKSHIQDEESNRYQGKFESFVQASSDDATWAAPSGTLMFVEELFHMDSKAASSANDSGPVGQLEHRGENLDHGECGNFSEEAVATQEGEMKAIAVSESSVAKIEEAGLYECRMSSENFSSSSANPCTGTDSQATRSVEQFEGQEGRRVFNQVTLEVSKENMFALLDGGEVEGSATLESKFQQSELTPSLRVAKNFTELPVTNVSDQVMWDRKESVESRSLANELEDSKLSDLVTAQHASVSLDAGAAGDGNTTMQEGNVESKDDIMGPEEYFRDFGWSYADTFDVDSSHQEVRAVDSQPPVESRMGNSVERSSKSGIDANQEQSNSSELDQTEESKGCVQSTPYSVIDDVIKNKENVVGLKMDSIRKHNDNKSAVSNSSRRPLQSVRREKDEH